MASSTAILMAPVLKIVSGWAGHDGVGDGLLLHDVLLIMTVLSSSSAKLW
jgi:hypothetical protein